MTPRPSDVPHSFRYDARRERIEAITKALQAIYLTTDELPDERWLALLEALENEESGSPLTQN